MTKVGPTRKSSYGQNRRFIGLEDFAIRRRLQPARRLIDRLRAENPAKTLKVLELGYGYRGRNLHELGRNNIELTGVDLAVAAEAQGFTLLEGDITQWEPPDSYDAVLSLAVVEHLTGAEEHFALIAKALSQGGLAGLTTPTPAADAVLSALSRLGVFDREEIADHKLYLTEAGLQRCAEQAGLDVLSYERFSLGLNQWMLLRKK